MSGLYNMLFGVEKVAPIALMMIGITHEDVPRFRDAYFTHDDGKPVIVVHTRVGGGNRDDYEGSIDEMRGLIGFIRDEDCDHDSTYADFYYAVPDEYAEAVEEHLANNGEPMSAAEKFEAMMSALRESAKTHKS